MLIKSPGGDLGTSRGTVLTDPGFGEETTMVSKTQESTQELPELARLRQRVSELETESLMLARENQRLRRTASFSSVILDTASEIFGYYDSSLRILWLNNACGKILGKQPEELVGRPCHEVWWGTEEPRGDCPAMQARDTAILVEAELTGSDQRIWQIRAYPVKDELGQVTGIIETGRDITHQESVGNALRASEERYRLLVDNANEGIMVAQDWRLPFVNRKVCEITGYSGKELTSRPFADFIHPDDREMVLERHGRRLNGEDFQSRYAFRVTTKDGAVRWLEISAVLFEWEGRPATLNFVDDVTERKRIDEAILRAKKEWEQTFDSVPDLICILAADHTIRRINRAMAERLGMRPQDAVGRQCFAVMHGSEGPPLYCPHVRLLEDGQEHREEFEVDHLGRCFDVTVSPLRNETGVVVGSVHVARDITARKRAESALRESEERYRQLYRMIRLMCDNVPDLIWAKDLEKRFIFVNRAMCRKLLIAADTEEPIGRTDMYFAQRERTAHREHPNRHNFGEICTDSDAVVISAKRAQRFDEFGNVKGQFLYLDVHKSPMWDEQGEMIGTVGCGRDVTRERQLEQEHRQAEETLRQTAALQRLLMRLATDFLNVPMAGTDTAIREALATIGSFIGADRAYRFAYDFDRAIMSNTHEWCAQGISAEIENLQNIHNDLLPEIVSTHLKGEKYSLERAADLPEHSRLRAILEPQGVQSLVLVPMMHQRDCLGFVGFDSVVAVRRFTDSEIALLEVLAEILANTEIRRRNEEALRLSERQFRGLLAELPDIVLVHSQGIIVYANQAALNATGYSREELVGTRVLDHVVPRHRETVGRLMRQRAAGEPVTDYEIDVVHKSGDIRNVIVRTGEMSFSDEASVIVILIDITERKQAELKLRESEEKFRTLAESCLFAIMIYQDDHWVYTNPAGEKISGFSAHELYGMPYWSFVHPEFQSLVREQGRNRQSGKAARSAYDFKIVAKGGEEKWVSLTGNSIEFRGRPAGLISVMDITERRRAEAERLEMERRLLHGQKLESLGVLAGGIAHDFNNLLMAIHGNLDLALHNLSPVSSARPNLAKAVQAAKRATDLTRQILAYSGRGQFIIGDVDLNELVLENSHLLRAAVSKNVTFSMQLGEGLPAIRADVGQIQQVVMNLITNGSEAIGEQAGILTLATGVEAYTEADLSGSLEEGARPGRFVCLEVTDTGCGMNSETRRRLVEPFFTTKSKGRGLGMAAVLGVVRGHDGAIFLESEPGKGTRVRVLFPQSEGMPADTDPAGDLPMEAPSPIKGSSTHGTILVVDDDPVVREVCRDMLEFIGYRVLEAEDGVDAVQVYEVRAGEIDGVILDYSMPRMDGVATLRELRRIRPEAKVILSSGYSEQETSLRFAGPDFDAFIQKPYHIKTLQRTLQRLFQTG
jgi:two-component system, cell cycle sensor histidine kinase and response regulator CckA